MELQDRIRDRIRSQLEALTDGQHEGILAGKKNMAFVPFVGNGLSRIALARQSSQGDHSYYSLIDGLCSRLNKPKLEHLIARGYLIDEVLRWIIKEQKGTSIPREMLYEIWRLYRDIIPDIKNGVPSPLHFVLAQTAKAFITTNYDLLLERTLHAIDRYDARFCKAVSMNKTNRTELLSTWNRNSKLPWIYKIHGSFTKLPNEFPKDDPLLDGDFNQILKSADGIDTLVASADVYNWWANECSTADFEKKFQGPLNILEEPKNLVVIVGHSMRAEERIIFRLLQTAKPTASYAATASILTITFEHEEDAILPRQGHIVTAINIPPGLAGSSLKRELAHLILLDELNNFGIIDFDYSSKSYLRDSLQLFPPLPLDSRKTFANMEPLFVSAGQVAYHTCRGLETAPSQERAYAPKKANWKPGDEAVKVLEVASPMGDAFVPTYLWEGLGIPSAFAGRVACDAAGRTILDYLSNETQYIDFSHIQQVTDSNAKTESATVACWMDLRLILDGERGFGYSVNMDDILPKRPGGRIIYASKPMLSGVINSLDNDGKDLLVFDTGGNCKASEFQLAISKRSVIIASAISLYQYMRALEWIGDDVSKIDEAWREVNEEYSRIEPTDETGRYKQMSLLLHELDKIKFDLTKSRVSRSLNKVDALACTLGPLGCLWWGKDKSKPIWTHVVPKTKPNQIDVSGQCLPFSEVRNALGCGDTSRGGYIASIVVQGNGLGDYQFDQFRAFEAMVWAGTSRIMFWDIRDFSRWLQKHRGQILDWFKGKEPNPLWPDIEYHHQSPGTDSLQPIRKIFHLDLLDPDNKETLMGNVHIWDKEILASDSVQNGRVKDTRSPKWIESIEEWRRARNLQFTR